MISAVTWDPKDSGLTAITTIAATLAALDGPLFLTYLTSEGIMLISDRQLDNAQAHRAAGEWAAYADEGLRETLDFTFDPEEFVYDVDPPPMEVVERVALPPELWQVFMDHATNLNDIYNQVAAATLTEYVIPEM